ncbi:MAG: COR domain-containing protein, partial [Cyanobacteria bacterium J06635_11]
TQTRNYIDLSAYHDICRQYGIAEQSEQNSLSQFLHDLGICLHFQKNIQLKKTLFLKPEWSTEAAYKVLNNKQVKTDCGRFSDADLLEIWNDEQYADMQGELLALMKAFEVCYEITGRQGHYIAPHLLEPNPPTYDIPWNSENNLTLTYRYTFKPRNILPRFIVALHEFIEYQRMVWKHGVVLSNNIARAEITEDTLYHNADIRIRISGQDKKQWLSVVAHHLERINASFDTLDYKILFPCPCPECKARTDPFEFTYEQLKNARNKGKPIQCLNSLDTIDARYLIDDVIGPQLSASLTERLPQEAFPQSNRTPFASEPAVSRDSFPSQNYQEKKTETPDDDQPVKVFLSYARQDGTEAAARLRQELMDAGFNVWQDTENMRGGEAWKEQLREALREVDAVVLLLTPNSVTSEYVKWEWEGAQFLQKLLIPVLISPCKPPPDLHRLQRRDLSTEKIYIKGLMSIVQDLNRC